MKDSCHDDYATFLLKILFPRADKFQAEYVRKQHIEKFL